MSEKAKSFLILQGINKATCYTDNKTLYFDDLAKVLTDFSNKQNAILIERLHELENIFDALKSKRTKIDDIEKYLNEL